MNQVMSSSVVEPTTLRNYYCDAQHAIRKSELSEDQAVTVFAKRWAKKLYGPKGYCIRAHVVEWCQSGTFTVYMADIGRDQRGPGGKYETPYSQIRLSITSSVA